MAHREFKGSDGRDWAVWTVNPEYAERRVGDGAAAPGGSAAPRVERRGRSEYRVPLAGKYMNGWLCFETRGEKRRLAPFPEDWANMSDAELVSLCDSASRVEHGSRRLVE